MEHQNMPASSTASTITELLIMGSQLMDVCEDCRSWGGDGKMWRDAHPSPSNSIYIRQPRFSLYYFFCRATPSPQSLGSCCSQRKAMVVARAEVEAQGLLMDGLTSQGSARFEGEPCCLFRRSGQILMQRDLGQ